MVIRGNKSSKRSRVTLKKRRQWCVREKLMVLHFLDRSNSVRATARHFDIEPSQVRDWRIHKGRNPYFSDLEQELANKVRSAILQKTHL